MLGVVFTVTRTVPRITVISEKVIYPGVNNLSFPNEQALRSFTQNPAYTEGIKTGFLRIDENPPDPIVTNAPNEIKTIWPKKEITEKRPGKRVFDIKKLDESASEE